MSDVKLDLPAARARLASKQGKEYWRSLEELAEDESFKEQLGRQVPRLVSGWATDVSRRQFLKVMGASLALAGLSACVPKQPPGKIVPYVTQPEAIVPGKPLFFATAMTLGGYALGLLGESHMGRPTKIEGNPDHPASLGATSAIAQASVLNLYDPDRSQVVTRGGQISTWDTFLGNLTPQLNGQGSGLRILTESITSPTLSSQLQQLISQRPQAVWHQYDSVMRDNVLEGARMAFGDVVETRYNFAAADVIFSLDSNFLLDDPGSVRYAREFIDGRRVRNGRPQMNRLYVVENTPTITGAMADHRLPVRASQVESVAHVVAAGLGVAGVTMGTWPEGVSPEWVAALVRDLQSHAGSSIVVAGYQQPAVVHALAHAMNQSLGNAGKTMLYSDAVMPNPTNNMASLRQLVQDMAAGQVTTLIIIGGNPVYDAPADLKFADALQHVGFRVHLSEFVDETSTLCHWHIPATHYLESWGDARAYDGTVTMIQPLIAPLYGGKSAHQLVAALLGQGNATNHDLVRNFWNGAENRSRFIPSGQAVEANSDDFWHRILHDGLIKGTELPSRQVNLQPVSSWAASPTVGSQGQAGANQHSLEVVFQPDPTVWDGRFANNGWLQELPKPITKLTWENAALISPATAQRLNVQNQEVVELTYQGRLVRAPIWILPGQANDVVTLTLGYGRTQAGRVGNGAGYNAYTLRASDAPWIGSGLEIHKVGDQAQLAVTQGHFTMDGREILLTGTIEEFQQNPYFAPKEAKSATSITETLNTISLLPEMPYKGYKWGMAIDLNACIGCNACITACQSENNIPVVGKNQVLMGREMHWIRVDRYYEGPPENPDSYFQPVPCMQCEKAPCEYVCPVEATVHGDEGLNEMVYNRCVGT
ncbi:MAG: TAT-variant-translocated molybdopterin oxidoreductase, partial [Chloroflexi bacterium]|nr:TAT-variant-translocated molybdopterin oxidoreductase [Chloroflexota bacterium]